MRVDEHSFDIFDVGVVLEGSLVETFLFAKSSYFGFVVELPDLHLEDAFSDLRSYHDVDFEHFGLVVAVFRLVLAHAVEKERSKLLNPVSLKEKVSDLMDVKVLVLLV